MQARVLQLLPPDAPHLVHLLAAGKFRHGDTLWDAVLVAPVVALLEAILSVQQLAQVTFDIAAAVDQLADLKIVHRDISPNNIGYLGDGHSCHGWLYDLGAAKVGSLRTDSWHCVISPWTLMCADLRTGEASTYNLIDLQVMDSSGSQSPVQTLTGTPMYMAIDVLMGQSSTPST